MKSLENRTNLKRKLSLTALAGMMALPLVALAPQSAQADPPRHAPAWGRRDRDRDRDRNRNRGNWRRDSRRDDRVNRITFSGRVIDSRNVRNQLRIRADGGRVYVVPTGTAHRYRVGDRVRISGRLSGSTVYDARISR